MTKLYVPKRNESEQYPIVDVNVDVCVLWDKCYISTLALNAAVDAEVAEQIGIVPEMLCPSHYVQVDCCGKVNDALVYRILSQAEESVRAQAEHAVLVAVENVST